MPSDHCQLRLCGGTGRCWDPRGAPAPPASEHPGARRGFGAVPRGCAHPQRPVEADPDLLVQLLLAGVAGAGEEQVRHGLQLLLAVHRGQVGPGAEAPAEGLQQGGQRQPGPHLPRRRAVGAAPGPWGRGDAGAWHRSLGAQQRCHRGVTRSGEGREPLERVPIMGWPWGAVTRPPGAAEPPHCPRCALQPLTSALLQLSSQGKKPRQPPLTGTQPGLQSDSSDRSCPAEAPGEGGQRGAAGAQRGTGGARGTHPTARGPAAGSPAARAPASTSVPSRFPGRTPLRGRGPLSTPLLGAASAEPPTPTGTGGVSLVPGASLCPGARGSGRGVWGPQHHGCGHR